ncbi:MAG: GspE/PulE/PilB domain-containing protein [Planctomycetota bacterium]|jgi:hypothetical protein
MGLLDGIFGGKKDGNKSQRKRGKASGSMRTKRSARRTAATPKKEAEPGDEAVEEVVEDAAEEVVEDISIEDVEEVDIEEIPSEEAASSKKAPPSVGKDRGTAVLPRKKPDSPLESSAPEKSEGSSASSISRRKRTSIARKQLGNLLIGADVINEAQLQKALEIQEKEGGLLGQILCGMDLCSTANIGTALNKQRTITTVELPGVTFDQDALSAISREQCERLRCIPFQKIGTMLCVAMSNVLDGSAKNEIKESTQLKLKAFDAAWSEIEAAIQQYFAEDKETPAQDLGDLGDDIAVDDAGADVMDLDDDDDLIIELPEEEFVEVSEAQPEAPAPAPAPVAEVESADEVVEIAEEDVVELEDDIEEVVEIEEVVDIVEADDDVLEVEDLDIDIVEEAPVTPVATASTAGSVMAPVAAIAVSDAYVKRVVLDGKVNLAAAWSEAQAGECAVPGVRLGD